MFELLSSDITKALYQEIGLPISNKEALIKPIRESLLTYYALPDSEKFNEESEKKFAKITLERISREVSNEVAWCVCQWGTQVFKYVLNERTIYGYWFALFLYCWDKESLWKALQLPQDKSELFKQNFLIAKDNSPFFSLYEQARQQLLSDWDLYLLNKSLKESEEDDYNFLDSLELTLDATAGIVRNQHFWQLVMQTFSQQDINILHQNAQKLTQLIEEFKFMEHLTHPSLLVPDYG